MQPATEELIKKMQDDKAFAEKILTCTENDEVIALAKEEEVALTLENIVEVNEVLQFAKRQEEGELSEDELEQVAGGTIDLVVVTVSVSMSVLTLTVVSMIASAVTVSTTVSVTVMSQVAQDQ